jgi:hypothetical protein
VVYLGGAAWRREKLAWLAAAGVALKTYAEILDVGEDLVVESEVIAGNDIDTGLLLDVPVLETQSLGLGEELCLGELAAPISFGGLLQLTVCSHAGKTENGSAKGIEISILQLKVMLRMAETHD